MVKIDYNESYRKGKLICDEDILDLVRDRFSEPIPNVGIMRKQSGNDKIPSRSYAVQRTAMFDFGLYEEIEKFLIEEQVTNVEFTEKFNNRINIGFEYDEIYDELFYKHRDYGIDAVRSSLDRGFGTILSATGSGKSFITASLLENIKRIGKFKSMKVLILVPGVGLVDQLRKDFNEYKVSFTYSGWTGKDELQNTEVIICNTENFCAKFKSNEKWIKKIDVLISDECHKAKNGNIITDYIKKITTPHKFGFTGTLPKTKIDYWKIIGTFGPIIFIKKSKELRDRGFLTNVVIKMVNLLHKNRKLSYRNELKYLYFCQERNEFISKLVNKLDNNTLILVNHLEHGEIIKESLKSETKEVFFVSGEMSVEDRAEIIRKMETQSNIICVAMSSIFSTGINIKNLHYILFIAGGKSFIRIVQSIGRGLRLHETKSKLVIIDIFDNMKYSENHADERKLIYDEEEIPWNQKDIQL